MTVFVNGEQRDVAPDVSIAGLLESLHMKSGQVAVQLNDGVLRREEFSETLLHENDVVEVIRIVGGG